jgi:hypothetical protein
MMERGNRHHILFPRRLHDAHPDTKELRRNHLLIPNMAVLGHAALHNEIAIVPPLDRFTAGRVLRDFYPVRDNHIKTIEEFMRSIEEATRHPKAREVEILNAQVAIHAIEMQIPYIREYLIQE